VFANASKTSLPRFQLACREKVLGKDQRPTCVRGRSFRFTNFQIGMSKNLQFCTVQSLLSARFVPLKVFRRSMNADQQDDDKVHLTVETETKSADARDELVHDRAAPMKQRSKSRKRRLQQADLGKAKSDDVKKKMMGTSSSVESEKWNQVLTLTDREYRPAGQAVQEEEYSKSTSDDNSSFTSKKGAFNRNLTQTAKIKEDSEGGDQPSEDRASMLYTENIMTAAAATNDELLASGMASSSASTYRQEGTFGTRISLPFEVSGIDVQRRYSLDASTLQIVRELVAENSQLRRRNEELLHDLQASRNILSRLLAGDVGAGQTQGGFPKIPGIQQMQPELLNNPSVNVSSMTGIGGDIRYLSGLLRQAQGQAGHSGSVGGQILSDTQILQGQQVALNPWLPIQALHSQRYQQHEPSHLLSLSRLPAAEQQILQQGLSQSAVAYNPQMQQYLSTDLAHQLLLLQSQVQRPEQRSRRPKKQSRKSKERPKRSDNDQRK
jgi:hypothetical protein